MSRLIWDAVGERYYENGVSRGVLYPQDATGAYPTGVAWNGLTGVTESPGGAEVTDLYADDIKYASMRSAETLGGTIEAYTAPEEFEVCDGSVELADGVYAGQQNRKPFGFCYRTAKNNDTFSDADDGYKLHLIYNATASPSERAYSSVNESPDAITLSWEFATTPVAVSGHKPTSRITIDSTKADSAKLLALENILYGTNAVTESGTQGQPGYVAAVEAAVARLPLPAEVLEIMGN